MSFLAPLFLLLAGAAAVPLLLHLLRRTVTTRVDFPAARYLLRAEQEHSRSLRLRNLLLMLLRVLLLLALALAAARPVIAGVGVGHGATAVAVVLDNSLSTSAVEDGAPVFDRLRRAARALLLAATPADQLWLVTADGRVRAGSRESLVAEIDALSPIEGAGDLPLALRRAAAAARAGGLPARAVAVATDGQRTAWTEAARTGLPTALLVADLPPPRNRAVSAVVVEPVRWTPRGALTARVVAPDSASYRVLLGERTLARGAVARDEPVALRVAPPERGWQAGRVELERDDFPADDARHYAVWIGPAPAVTSTPSAGPFVATALGALVADGRATNGASVRIASADEVSSLPALLLPPADPVRLGAANRALARLGIPWRIGPVSRVATSARGQRLDDVAVQARHALERVGTAPSDTLATAGGAPWIVAGPGYVLVASRLEPADTQLPVRAAFVPWLAEMLGLRLGAPAGDLGSPIETTPGAALSLPAGVEYLESASGVRRTVTGTAAVAPAERGVWFAVRGGRRVGAVVIDADATESALACYPGAELASRLGGDAGRATRSADRWISDTYAAGTRRPAVTPLLLLALLLLVGEALVLRTSRSTAA